MSVELTSDSCNEGSFIKVISLLVGVGVTI